jgi:tyrosyl-tRNA synthetase
VKVIKQEKDSPVKIEAQLEKLKKNLEMIVPADGLAEKLSLSHQKKTPLRVKLGFDPTAPDLHLGHAVVLKKYVNFKSLGIKLLLLLETSQLVLETRQDVIKLALL